MIIVNVLLLIRYGFSKDIPGELFVCSINTEEMCRLNQNSVFRKKSIKTNIRTMCKIENSEKRRT